MYDITIIGAGPAGSTLARLLAGKYKILLIEKRDLLDNKDSGARGKCCGGLLAPDAQYMIAKLGLGIPREILVDPQIFAVRTIDLNTKLEQYYQRYYFNLDREKFDRWLVSLISDNVDLRFKARFISIRELSGVYEIQYTQNGKKYIDKTRVLIGADGASSRVRRLAFPAVPHPLSYISIQEWFTCPSPSPYYTALFDRDITDFYAWTIPKNDVLLLGAALTPGPTASSKFELLKKRLIKYGFNFDNKIKREGAFILRPRRNSQLFGGKGQIALIGEAAGAISPSSAEGFSYAFKSALYLAKSLEPEIDGFADRYRKNMQKLKLNILLKNAKSPAMYHPLLRSMALKSGFLSIKIDD